jgi:hypothetical protein
MYIEMKLNTWQSYKHIDNLSINDSRQDMPICTVPWDSAPAKEFAVGAAAVELTIAVEWGESRISGG